MLGGKIILLYRLHKGLQISFKQGSVNPDCDPTPNGMVWDLQWCEVINYGFFLHFFIDCKRRCTRYWHEKTEKPY